MESPNLFSPGSSQNTESPTLRSKAFNRKGRGECRKVREETLENTKVKDA